MTPQKVFSSVLTTAVMVASLSLATNSARAADAPNIVLIMSDDMGVSKQFDWELDNVKADRAELQNVADKNPGKVEALLAKWETWALRAKVQPWPYQTK